MRSAEGITHKRQRRVATPASSIQNLRAFASIVFEKGFRLKNRWHDIISKTVKDVCEWVGRATFDVMGATGLYIQHLSRRFLDDTKSYSRL